MEFTNRNKRRHEEQDALYREIAAYYREQHVKGGKDEVYRRLDAPMDKMS